MFGIIKIIMNNELIIIMIIIIPELLLLHLFIIYYFLFNNLHASPACKTGFPLNFEQYSKQASFAGSITNRTCPTRILIIITVASGWKSFKNLN